MGDFMKTLQKYTCITLLLLSAAAIIPTYANQTMEQENTSSKEESIIQRAKSINDHIIRYMKKHPVRVIISYCILCETAASTDGLLRQNKPFEGLLNGSIGIMLTAGLLLSGLK
jgi:hypothetical protein